MKVKELKKGDLFTKKVIETPRESQVWIRGEYDRSCGKYECTRFDDASSSCCLPGDREVFTDFVF